MKISRRFYFKVDAQNKNIERLRDDIRRLQKKMDELKACVLKAVQDKDGPLVKGTNRNRIRKAPRWNRGLKILRWVEPRIDGDNKKQNAWDRIPPYVFWWVGAALPLLR